MIVQCPRCQARYRFEEGKTPGASARLKCKRCEVPFTVELPPSTSPAARQRTALLADEPRDFRDLVHSVLEEAGFEVSVTDDGEQALLLAGSHRFDLIVLNSYLRKIVGIKVCERLKKTPELLSVPVLLIGSIFDSKAPSAAPGQRFGADGLITPGITRMELSARIAGVPSGAPDPQPAPESPTPPPAADGEHEIRRLARIMISDLQMYHPHRFSQALSEGSFVQSFAEELGQGRRMIEGRFGHIPGRLKLLAEGLRDALEEQKAQARSLRPSRD